MDIAPALQAATPLPSRSAAVTGVTARAVLLSLVAMLGVQNILLLVFLGRPWPMLAGSAGAVALLLFALHHVLATQQALTVRIGWRLLATCLAISLGIYLLGGEGRFFYANTDWQVRGAVLHDLAHNAWPFAYATPAGDVILRAPLGMYLPPAALAKLTGEGTVDILLLIENALLLTGVLSLGSLLFGRGRPQAMALAVFLGFSGMDCIGAWLTGHRLDVHLEQWTGLQYSAQLTQAYWVPQHSLAGWIGALLYLLWREERIPLVAFAAACPLIALLSPLAMLGLVPFMAHAGVETLLRRRLTLADIGLPLLAVAIALPSLLYLAAGSGKVGGDVEPPTLLSYAVSVTLEVGLPLVALFLHGGAHRFGRVTSFLVLAILLVVPFGHVGSASDFVMRASIPALAVLTLLIAQMLATPATTERQRLAVGLVTVALVIGLVTPVTETIRAIRFPASPALRCTYAQVVPGGGAATYVAPVTAFSPAIRPQGATRVDLPAREDCWDGPWPAGEVTGLFDRIAATPGRVFVPGPSQKMPMADPR